MATTAHTETDAAELEELAYVGPRTAERLAAAGVAVTDVREKRVSYRQLVDAGVNPGVAAKLRREHSLHWTLDEQAADLDRRSELVRGLQEDERAWIASAKRDDGDDAPADDWAEQTRAARSDERETSTADTEEGDGDDAFAAEAAWRERTNGSP